MPASRGLRAVAVVFALAACVGVTLAAPAAAAPPVVQDDHKWMYPNQFRTIDVLANDSDPDGDELAICRVDDGPEDAEYFAGVEDNKLFVATGDDPGEDIVIHYYVCDFETLVPATLTISFRELHPIEVVKLDRPGLLRVSNDNSRVVRFLYGSFRQERPDGRTRVFPHDSVVIRVHRHRIDWLAYFPRGGILVGIGHVRGIELPADKVSDGDRAGIPLGRREAKLWGAQR
ncbi:Ig-like domain-containing protein [Nocardioides bizhenqiangii]|uniref:Ig-like domain-containing protein n=1 Tax=Nocardioides bizhenqiangii TaxID=3095076 RepID=A0ABZ0ZPL5_9ACTN|nr:MULTISPECIES: Ig-like domain-containing protein [unclassified Nocardioides]MDZ5619746.1 Ig-like domain-containing protein [Nocardioides sp. HM23]WQQ26247.1 Ig-like domain-containing protein [Nocardioides sp. HM61]